MLQNNFLFEEMKYLRGIPFFCRLVEPIVIGITGAAAVRSVPAAHNYIRQAKFEMHKCLTIFC